MTTKTQLKLLGVKVPDKLIKGLDKAAKQSGRTRSGEARIRLERSLKQEPLLGVGP